MTDRRHSAGVVAFLENVLADRGLCVPELEVMARAAGLLGQRQSITHAKVFKKDKKSLGIRSVRNGFGDGGEWLWRLERRPASPVSKPVSIEDTYAEALGPGEAPADVRARRIRSGWNGALARLDHHRPLTDIPPHRWRQFLSDCNNFLTAGENWAGRAAELGWNAATLFGCRRARPLDHPGGAGLLWAINGGRLVELHRDWAVIELAANGSRRVFERRGVDAVSRVVLIDLPKDGRPVIEDHHFPPKQTAWAAPGKLCSRKNANRRRVIFRRSKSDSAGIEVLRSQFLTDLSRTGLYLLQAIVAHAGTFSVVSSAARLTQELCEEPCGSRRIGFRFNRGASGYDSGPLDGRKKMAAHPCIVLPPERSSPCATGIRSPRPMLRRRSNAGIRATTISTGRRTKAQAIPDHHVQRRALLDRSRL